MNTVLSPKAAKYLERLHEPTKGRIKAALKKLEQEPPQGDISTITGREGFRLRVGCWEVSCTIWDYNRYYSCYRHGLARSSLQKEVIVYDGTKTRNSHIH